MQLYEKLMCSKSLKQNSARIDKEILLARFTMKQEVAIAIYSLTKQKFKQAKGFGNM